MTLGGNPARSYGVTLIELLVAMLLTALLLLGLVQMVSAGGAATLLQDNQAQLKSQAHLANRLLSSAIAQAGYRPEPWNPHFDIPAILEDTADGVSATSDRLVLLTWSDLNCFDNRNPVVGTDGKPRFYLRETAFDLNTNGYLTRDCRYGPSADQMTRQIRRQGMVPGVESFQLQFGEDSNDDGNIDRWVNSGQWTDENRLLGIRSGLLLVSENDVIESAPVSFNVLDTRLGPRHDGRLRELLVFATAIRGRSG